MIETLTLAVLAVILGFILNKQQNKIEDLESKTRCLLTEVSILQFVLSNPRKYNTGDRIEEDDCHGTVVSCEVEFTAGRKKGYEWHVTYIDDNKIKHLYL